MTGKVRQILHTLRDNRRMLFMAFFLIVCLWFSSWLMFHTFSYDQDNHAMLLAPKVWSDFGAHIPLIRSFSMGANWERITHGHFPEYPLFPGEPIRYHFMFYLGVGILERIGLPIHYALNIPSVLGFFLMLAGLYLAGLYLFRSHIVGALSVIFTLFNGSLSFIRFFTDHPPGRQSIHDVVTNNDFAAFAPWGPGDISAFWNLNIYTNQRHLAVAFAMALLFMLTVLNEDKLTRTLRIVLALGWTCIIGSLPFFHQPMLLVFAVLFIWYFLIFPQHRIFLFSSGLMSAAVIIAQFPLLPKTQSFFELHPGYLMTGPINLLSFVTYWFHNLGLHLLLIPLGYLLAPKTAKKTLFPLFIIFLIANLFQFSREMAANHKFFNFALILGNLLSAYVIVTLYSIGKETIRKIAVKTAVIRIGLRWLIRVAMYTVIGLLILFSTLSGVIDFFAVASDEPGHLPDSGSNPAVLWIKTNTDPQAVFLNSSYLFHPASIAGRGIFLGWPYFSWSAGYPDRMPTLKRAYQSKTPEDLCPILRENNLSYVTVEPVEENSDLPEITMEFLDGYWKPVYKNSDNTFAIFKTSDLCHD